MKVFFFRLGEQSKKQKPRPGFVFQDNVPGIILTEI